MNYSDKNILREYLSSALILEISKRNISQFLEEIDPSDLPFNQEFNGQKRIAVPFVGGIMKEIVEFYNSQDGVEVNPMEGTISMTKKGRNGDQVSTMRLGKKLGKDYKTAKKARDLAIKKLSPQMEPMIQRAFGIEKAGLVGEKSLEFSKYASMDSLPESDLKDISDAAALRALRHVSNFDPYRLGGMVFLPGWSVKPTVSEMEELKGMWKDVVEKNREFVEESANKSEHLKEYERFVNGYNKQGGGYSVIISRSPIDIVRMSDFKNLRSCHSEGGSYFQCAIDEAEDGGGVAFLVMTTDLEGVDLNEQEIFKDDSRGIEGISPSARLRLRRFDHNDSGDNLMLPETSVYGTNIDGFLDAVTKWSFETQKEKFTDEDGDIEYPEMSEYTRAGGSYSDTASAELMNNFFSTDRYSGDVSGTGLLEQFMEEMDQFGNEARDIDYVSVDWDIEDDGEGPYGMWSAQLRVPAPKLDIQEEKVIDISRFMDYIEPRIDSILEYVDYNRGYAENSAHFVFSFYPNNNAGHPDEFREFIENDLREASEEVPKIAKAIRGYLIQIGVLDETGIDHAFDDTIEENQYENFEIDLDEDTIETEDGILDFGEYVILTTNGALLRQLKINFSKEMLEKALDVAQGRSLKQILIPGTNSEGHTEEEVGGAGVPISGEGVWFDIIIPESKETADYGVFTIRFSIDFSKHNSEELAAIGNYVEFLDNNFERIKSEAVATIFRIASEMNILRTKLKKT